MRITIAVSILFVFYFLSIIVVGDSLDFNEITEEFEPGTEIKDSGLHLRKKRETQEQSSESLSSIISSTFKRGLSTMGGVVDASVAMGESGFKAFETGLKNAVKTGGDLLLAIPNTFMKPGDSSSPEAPPARR